MFNDNQFQFVIPILSVSEAKRSSWESPVCVELV